MPFHLGIPLRHSRLQMIFLDFSENNGLDCFSGCYKSQVAKMK